MCQTRDFALIQQNNIPSHLYIGVAGYPKQGEIFEDTVKREVLEEIGLIVEKDKYIKSYNFAQRDMIMLGFISEVKHFELKLSKEVDNANWFTKEEAAKVLPEGSIVLHLFQDYIERTN